MNCFLVAASLLCCVCFDIVNAEALPKSLRNCHDLPTPGRITAYFEWEFRLNCDVLDSSWTSVFGSPNASSQFQCIVKGEGANYTLASASIRLPTTASRTLPYILFLVDSSRCLRQNVTIVVKDIPSKSCVDEATDHVTRNVNVHRAEVVHNEHVIFNCSPAEPPLDPDHVPPPAVDSTLYKTQWYYVERNRSGHVVSDRCVKLKEVTPSPELQLQTIGHSDRPDSVKRLSLRWAHAGVYSCAVTYNNRTIFVTHYAVCIKHKKVVKDPIVGCTSRISFKSDEKVEVKCTASVGLGKIQTEDLKVRWRKISSSTDLCANENYTMPSTSPSDRRVGCRIENYANQRVPCFVHVATKDERDAAILSGQMDLLLEIRAGRQRDAGRYEVQLTNGKRSKTATFVLDFEKPPNLGLTVGVSLSATAVAAGIIFITCYNWVRIKLFYRRHFQKYDMDGDKLYVAYLAYYYSQEMDEDDKKDTKRIVDSIKKKMKELRYTYYDQYEEYTQGFEFSTLLSKLKQSHRMIIILTKDFVNQNWSRFAAEQGFRNMLQSKTKLIFVCTPKSKTVLKELNNQRIAYTDKMIKAMEACRNVKWTPKTKDSRFLCKIEYALPYLKRLRERDDPDNLSTEAFRTHAEHCEKLP